MYLIFYVILEFLWVNILFNFNIDILFLDINIIFKMKVFLIV